MKKFVRIASLVVLVMVCTMRAYTLTPTKTIIINKDDVVRNYAFDGSVVTKDNVRYRIGAKNCTALWLNEVDSVVHKYKWIK